jgi:hypothetical protein
MTDIRWKEQRDNFIEGIYEKWSFFILMKKIEDKLLPYSLFIISPCGEKEKIMAEEYGADTIEKVKWIAENLDLK